MAKTEKQGLPIQPQMICIFAQDARNQDAPEAVEKLSSHQLMNVPKAVNGGPQDQFCTSGPEALVKFGKQSNSPQSQVLILSVQDARNQDAPEAMPKIDGRNMMDVPLWILFQNKVDQTVGHEQIVREDSDAIMQQEVRTNDKDSTMPAAQIREYGANNLLLPPLVEPLPRPSTPVRVSEPMDEAPETPKTGNVIQPLVKNRAPPQATNLNIFIGYRLIQPYPLITFNSKNGWMQFL
jgi:hypothetical protein